MIFGKLKILFFVFLFLITGPVSAAVYYVTSSGAGSKDGTSWGNAYAGFSSLPWSTMTAGSTIWIGGGNYSSLTVGTSNVSIKHQASDPQAIISGGISLGTNNGVIIDGGGEKGIKLTFGECGTGVNMRTSQNNQLRNMEIVGPGVGYRYLQSCGGEQPGIYIPVGYTATNLFLHNVDIHDTQAAFWIGNSDGLTVENSEIYDIGSGNEDPGNGVGVHSNLMYMDKTKNMTFRYNNVYRYTSTGLYAAYSGNQYTGLKIYGNVFHDSITSLLGRTVQAEIYNNTFYNVGPGHDSSQRGNFLNLTDALTGTAVYNNIFWNTSYLNLKNNSNNFYNRNEWGYPANEAGGVYSTIDPTTANAGNFTLKINSLAINAGKTLAAEYSLDAAGNTRGPGGTMWDIGAYEYGSSVPSTSHPADTNSDFLMALNEATAFGSCWKTNCSANATLDNAVRAGTLWNATANGQYQYNLNQICPMCWEVKQ